MPENILPFESIVWYDLYVSIPGVEGEIKMTFTDKGASTEEALAKTLSNIQKMIELRAEDYPFAVRGGYPVVTGKPAENKAQGAAPDGEYDGSFTLDHIDIIPRTDGKVNVNFFAVGHKYADVYTSREPAAALAYINQTFSLQNTIEDYAKALSLPVSGTLFWKNSKNLNSKGNPYKNIVRIEV